MFPAPLEGAACPPASWPAGGAPGAPDRLRGSTAGTGGRLPGRPPGRSRPGRRATPAARLWGGGRCQWEEEGGGERGEASGGSQGRVKSTGSLGLGMVIGIIRKYRSLQGPALLFGMLCSFGSKESDGGCNQKKTGWRGRGSENRKKKFDTCH